MLNVSVRITDATTNQPTPVRLQIADAAGRVYPPLGRLAVFAHDRGEDVGGHLHQNDGNWYYIDGSCEVPLPSGTPLVLKASKGPEYVPVCQPITLGVGKMALRLSIARWVALPTTGWYSGDTRCHFLSPHAALLEGQAEDLAVVNLLALQDLPHRITNLLAFSGQRPCLESPGTVVAVNTLNSHRTLGRLALLHCHRTVFPLQFGEPNGTDDWALADWCDQCHRKNGLVVWCEPLAPHSDCAPEALADLILGRIDAVEITPECGLLNELYGWWSAGIWAPIVGASGKDSNRKYLGSLRTYTFIPPPEAPSYTNWIEAVRSGATFATSGPILEFTVDGQPIGSRLNRQVTDAPLKIRATVRGATLPGPLEILSRNGVIARTDQFGTGPFAATLECEYPAAASTWLAARCVAPPSTTGFAHTSPVFVQVGDRPLADESIAKQLANALECTSAWVEKHGRFDVPKRKEALLAVLRQAQQKILCR